MTKARTWWIGLLSMTVVLAGCVSDDGTGEGPAAIDSGGTEELGDKGAINGLIVDDNYRPVQLKEDWGNQGPGDYQDVGFVLILETAQRFETNENGEFQVRPIEPGTYTIRVAADNHEAIDKKVQVVAGEVSEVTVEARRQFSSGGTVLSQEYVLFTSCTVTSSAVKVALAAVGGCGDLSGDSGRFDFNTNYANIKDDVRGMVTEMLAHQDGYYSITIRNLQCTHSEQNAVNGCEYADWFQYDERYGRAVLYPGLAFTRTGDEGAGTDEVHYREEGQEGWCHPNDETYTDCTLFWAFILDDPFQTALFPDHPSKYYQDQVTNPWGCHDAVSSIPNPAVNDGIVPLLFCNGWGNGVTLGTKAQFVQNVFLYELPDKGIEDYCVLCEDADIPE